MIENSTEKYKWWEKSVEYKFIAEVVNSKSFTLLMPLDGEEEKIGDAVFAKDSQYVIVEFKRKLSDFSSEYKKYKTDDDSSGKDNFKLAKAALQKIACGQHHLLVSGVLSDETEPSLSLKFYEYLSCDNKKTCTELPGLMAAVEGGIEKELFDEYVLCLSTWKTKTSETGSEQQGSGSVGLTVEAVVVGIGKSGMCTIEALDTYTQLIKLEIAPPPPRFGG